MKIEIDVAFLKAIELTPEDYVYLMSLYKKEDPVFSMTMARAVKLEQLGYVKILEENGKPSLVLRPKFLGLIEGDFDRMWAELCSAYPHKVGLPNNYRVLHAKDPDANSNKKARARYKKYVEKDQNLHRKIIGALDNQLKHQRNNLQYMQLLEVWINNATWEKWMDFEEEKDDSRRTEVF